MNEFEIQTQQGALRVVQMGNPNGMPVIALHGWLDNAASFFPLGEHLQHINCYALDLAGHGHSYHRAYPYNYNIWDDLLDIDEVAEALGLKKFSLLAHSRGAMIAALYTASSPERISKLGLIDGYINKVSDVSDGPKVLAAYRKRRLLGRKRMLRYTSLAPMIKMRTEGFLAVSEVSAKRLVERNVKKVDGGYVWQTDQALRWRSALHLSHEQGLTFAHSINCPSHLWLAESSIKGVATASLFAEETKNMTQSTRRGGHHFHMETDVAEFAAEVEAFFND